MIGRSVRRLRAVFLFAAVLLALSSVTKAAPPLTNADIENLVMNKISDSIILDLIRTQPSAFNVSAEAIVHLKQKGASDAVIGAIIKTSAEERPSTPSQPAPPPPQQPSAPYTFIGEVTGVTWHGCNDGRFCYQTGKLSWSQDGVWFTMSYDAKFYNVDAATGREFSLSWSQVDRICLDDGPWNTWVRLYAGSQVYKFLIGDMHGKRWGSYILDDISRAKKEGFDGLKHVTLSYSCG